MPNMLRYTRNGDYNNNRSSEADPIFPLVTSHRLAIKPVIFDSGDSFFQFFDLTDEGSAVIVDMDTRDFLSPNTDGLYANLSENTAVVSLTGGDMGDVLRTGFAKDELNGGGGDDVLDGGAGADLFTGGSGYDTVTYGFRTDAVTVSDQDVTGLPVETDGDSYDGIEALIGSNFDDVFLIDGAFVIEGGRGADTITTLYVEDSAATASYAHSAKGVYVDLSGATANMGGDAEVDQLYDMSRVIGSTHADTLIASATTGSTLNGFGGLDTLTGGVFDDTLIVRGAWASIDGGGGSDRLIVRGESDGATIRPDKDTLSNVETVIVGRDASLDLSGQAGIDGVIVLRGDKQGASVIGTDDADRIRGSQGFDHITGGGGRDRLSGGYGPDTFTYAHVGDSAPGAKDVILDFAGKGREDDVIDLSGIGTFAFVEKFSGEGGAEVRSYTKADGVQIVQADADGDGKADLTIRVNSADALTADDFILGQDMWPSHGAMPHQPFAEALHPADLTALA